MAGEWGVIESPKGHTGSSLTLADVREYFRRSGALRIPSGYGKRADALGKEGLTLPRGGVTVIAGRPANGKTSLMLNLLRNLLEATESGGRLEGRQLHFFTYEESREALALKLLLLQADVVFDEANNYEEFLKRFRDEVESEPITAAEAWLGAALAEGRLQLHFGADLPVVELAARVTASAGGATDKVAAVFVDYVQKVPPSRGAAASQRYLQMQEVSSQLTALAARHRLALVVGAQLNRNTYEARRNEVQWPPSLNSIRESADIGQDANLVLAVQLTGTSRQDAPMARMDVHVVKNRDGRSDFGLELDFRGATRRLYDRSDGARASNLPKVKAPSYGAGVRARPPASSSEDRVFDVDWKAV